MKIIIDRAFDIPSSTPQKRETGGGAASRPTQGLRYARAAWRAFLEKYKPARPVPKGRAVILQITLYYHTKDKKLDGHYKTTRPDGDNLLKIIKDAATKAGWWEDDAQVQDSISRRWTAGEERVEITAWDVLE